MTCSPFCAPPLGALLAAYTKEKATPSEVQHAANLITDPERLRQFVIAAAWRARPHLARRWEHFSTPWRTGTAPTGWLAAFDPGDRLLYRHTPSGVLAYSIRLAGDVALPAGAVRPDPPRADAD